VPPVRQSIRIHRKAHRRYIHPRESPFVAVRKPGSSMFYDRSDKQLDPARHRVLRNKDIYVVAGEVILVLEEGVPDAVPVVERLSTCLTGRSGASRQDQ
jgi:hypothetical protein